MTTEGMKTEIRDLCMEIIGLSYESKPDPVKILNRSMALANVNAALAREWAASIADEVGSYSILPNPSNEDLAWKKAAHLIATKIRENVSSDKFS